MTFTQAAGSLEKSYTQLQAEVGAFARELQRANSELERSLEENARMRGYLIARAGEFAVRCGGVSGERPGADHQSRSSAFAAGAGEVGQPNGNARKLPPSVREALVTKFRRKVFFRSKKDDHRGSAGNRFHRHFARKP